MHRYILRRSSKRRHRWLPNNAKISKCNSKSAKTSFIFPKSISYRTILCFEIFPTVTWFSYLYSFINFARFRNQPLRVIQASYSNWTFSHCWDRSYEGWSDVFHLRVRIRRISIYSTWYDCLLSVYTKGEEFFRTLKEFSKYSHNKPFYLSYELLFLVTLST